MESLRAARRSYIPVRQPKRAEATAGPPGRVDEAHGHRFERVPTRSGERLPAGVESRLSNHFGRDLSDVRVHEGPEAAELGAHAFARGPHLFFAPGRYRPSSAEGRALIGHEVAHLEQQRGGGAGGRGVNDDPSLERGARDEGLSAARAIVSERPAPERSGPLLPTGGFGGGEVVQCAKDLEQYFGGSEIFKYSKGKTGYIMIPLGGSVHATIFTDQDLTEAQIKRLKNSNTVQQIQALASMRRLTFSGFHISFEDASEEGGNVGYHYTDDGNLDTNLAKQSSRAIFDTSVSQQQQANQYAAQIYKTYLGLSVSASHLNTQSTQHASGKQINRVVAKTSEQVEREQRELQKQQSQSKPSTVDTLGSGFDIFSSDVPTSTNNNNSSSSSSSSSSSQPQQQQQQPFLSSSSTAPSLYGGLYDFLSTPPKQQLSSSLPPPPLMQHQQPQQPQQLLTPLLSSSLPPPKSSSSSTPMTVSTSSNPMTASSMMQPRALLMKPRALQKPVSVAPPNTTSTTTTTRTDDDVQMATSSTSSQPQSSNNNSSSSSSVSTTTQQQQPVQIQQQPPQLQRAVGQLGRQIAVFAVQGRVSELAPWEVNEIAQARLRAARQLGVTYQQLITVLNNPHHLLYATYRATVLGEL